MTIMLANANDYGGFAPQVLRWLNLPGLADYAKSGACTQLMHVEAQRKRLREAALNVPPADEHAATAPIREALEAGADLPDIVATLSAAARYTSDVALVAELLRSLDSELGVRRDEEATRAVAGILPHLHEQVVGAVTEGRRLLPKVKGAGSLEQARAAGAMEPWDALTEARQSYAQARVAQRQVTPNGASVAPTWERVAYLANPEQVWGEDFLYWYRGVGAVEVEPRRTRGIRPPWPDQRDHGAYFDWLLRTPKATPWVPTWDQLEQRIETVNAASRALVDAQRPTTPPPGAHSRYVING